MIYPKKDISKKRYIDEKIYSKRDISKKGYIQK
jgi:hypothetical protein